MSENWVRKLCRQKKSEKQRKENETWQVSSEVKQRIVGGGKSSDLSTFVKPDCRKSANFEIRLSSLSWKHNSVCICAVRGIHYWACCSAETWRTIHESFDDNSNCCFHVVVLIIRCQRKIHLKVGTQSLHFCKSHSSSLYQTLNSPLSSCLAF